MRELCNHFSNECYSKSEDTIVTDIAYHKNIKIWRILILPRFEMSNISRPKMDAELIMQVFDAPLWHIQRRHLAELIPFLKF